MLLDYGRSGAEAVRQAKEDLFSVQNSRKARVGGPGGPARPGVHGPQGAGREGAAVPGRGRREEASSDGAAWDRIAEAQKTAARILKPLQLSWSAASAFDSTLFEIARTLVRLAEEKAKPNSDRLKEYRESGLEVARAAALLRGADLPRV